MSGWVAGLALDNRREEPVGWKNQPRRVLQVVQSLCRPRAVHGPCDFILE
jgi:hypothetical protein